VLGLLVGTGNLSARQTFIRPAAAASPYPDERANIALLGAPGTAGLKHPRPAATKALRSRKLSLPGPRLEINLGLLSSQVPPSPSDSIELAECPAARQVPPPPSDSTELAECPTARQVPPPPSDSTELAECPTARQVPPSPSDSTELAECPTARQVPPSPSLRRDRPWPVYF